MTFEIAFLLVGLMQIAGYFIQGCTGFGCAVIAAPVTNGLLGTAEGVTYSTLLTLPFMYGLIVHGAFNIGGPLITVYTLEAVKEKEKFRNTMTWLWAILNTVNAINQYRNGAWTPHLWSALAVGAPLAAIGFFLGMAFLKKINREQFLRIVYIVLLIIGSDIVNKAAKSYTECGATSLVALGGGSPMDVAKSAGILAVYGGKLPIMKVISRFPALLSLLLPSQPLLEQAAW